MGVKHVIIRPNLKISAQNWTKHRNMMRKHVGFGKLTAGKFTFVRKFQEN